MLECVHELSAVKARTRACPLHLAPPTRERSHARHRRHLPGRSRPARVLSSPCDTNRPHSHTLEADGTRYRRACATRHYRQELPQRLEAARSQRYRSRVSKCCTSTRSPCGGLCDRMARIPRRSARRSVAWSLVRATPRREARRSNALNEPRGERAERHARIPAPTLHCASCRAKQWLALALAIDRTSE